MNTKRLLKLCDFLETIPNKQFNIGCWTTNRDHTPHKSKHTCKTIACIGGWACAIPSFKRAGLKLNTDGIPSYKDLTHTYALELFFKLTEEETYNIFIRGLGYTTPKPIVNALRKLIQNNIKENS